MSEENRQLMRGFVQEVFNDHDVDATDRYFAPDYVEHNPWERFPATVEGFKQGTAAFLAAFPDTRYQIDDLIAEGDKVVARSRLIGTNTGQFLGMPPTGRSVVAVIDIARFDGGRMVEHWGLVDASAMMAQLGLAPAGG